MNNYSVFLCRLCGKKYKIYSMEVYIGDNTCCRECNKFEIEGDT